MLLPPTLSPVCILFPNSGKSRWEMIVRAKGMDKKTVKCLISPQLVHCRLPLITLQCRITNKRASNITYHCVAMYSLVLILNVLELGLPWHPAITMPVQALFGIAVLDPNYTWARKSTTGSPNIFIYFGREVSNFHYGTSKKMFVLSPCFHELRCSLS